jgi:hypothetical protein
MPASVSELNKVDLPTLGNPTIPHLKPMNDFQAATPMVLWPLKEDQACVSVVTAVRHNYQMAAQESLSSVCKAFIAADT